jgi:hypothetical protein
LIWGRVKSWDALFSLVIVRFHSINIGIDLSFLSYSYLKLDVDHWDFFFIIVLHFGF